MYKFLLGVFSCLLMTSCNYNDYLERPYSFFDGWNFTQDTGLAGGGVMAEEEPEPHKTPMHIPWHRTRVVSIILDEFFTQPKELVLEQGVPYRLEIRNEGMMSHVFEGERFFRAGKVYNLITVDGEITPGNLSSFRVYPGRFWEIYYFPQRAGRYTVFCSDENHDQEGMMTTILIQ